MARHTAAASLFCGQRMRAQLFGAALVPVIALSSGSAPAAPTARTACSSEITMENVVHCAVRASLIVRRSEQAGEALGGRRVAAEPVLPSNPVLALSAGRNAGPGPNTSATTWSASLGQELEIAGQRGARLRAADGDLRAQGSRVVLSEREVAVSAWEAFYETIASDEEVAITRRLEAASRRVDSAARAMADKGVLSPIDADVAQASTVRITQGRLAAERRSQAGRATLASMLGRDPASPILVSGDLLPLRVADTLAARGEGGTRPEVQAALYEQSALEARADSLRRARFPNVTVSVFAANDSYSDKVVGVGLSLPIPLPQPLGRTYAGEIREVDALAARAGTNAEELAREVRLERATALATYVSRKAEVQAFTPEQISHADQSLQTIAGEIEAGRLGIRDALITEQALIGLLLGYVDARRNLCLASVALARASGVALESGAR